MQFGGSYTYGRYFSNNDASLGEGGTAQSPQLPQNNFDYGAEWSTSGFDRRHRLTFNYLWEIPAPKQGLIGAIIGGWQIAGVTQTQSGAPFTIRTGVDSNGDGSLTADRPNINTSGSITWNDDHSAFTNNGYYVESAALHVENHSNVFGTIEIVPPLTFSTTQSRLSCLSNSRRAVSTFIWIDCLNGLNRERRGASLRAIFGLFCARSLALRWYSSCQRRESRSLPTQV